MMTPAEFKKRTSEAFSGRGVELRAIDEALEACSPPKTAHEEQKRALVHLIGSINIWLNTKSDQHGAKVTSLYAKRKRAIEELREEAFKAVAAASFARNKALGAFDPTRTKSLEGGYAHERTHFERTKQAMGADREAFTGVVPGASVVSEATKKGLMALPPGKTFGTLTQPEFDAIWGQLNAMGLDNPTQQKLQVHLIRKEERISKFLAWLLNGKFYKQESIPYTSDAKSIEIYAMDRYGNMITMPSVIEFKGNARAGSYARGVQSATHAGYRELTQHNHSSLNAGRDVISAGVIRIDQGVITYIDNVSGHYKPTPRQLQRCVNVLRNEFADLSRLQVTMATLDAAGHAHMQDFRSADEFLAARL